ncbi:ATP-binding protein [Anaerocolumna sp. AGMB13025]|uniref:sensor histidine kinase n=1 Tax=Anaerocolumna sp. AGMB13025 TaxID=3039116 RepID=UPI00241E74A6|nr:ATP-binding protein [Anaerocolumna sp. AGMB13025]WFR57339.1 ATP-binding protein [Anaerocolumna sp. AGMB13025]
MENILFIINYAFALIFGVTLSFSLAGAAKSRNDRIILWGVCAIIGILEFVVYLLLGQDFLFKAYPFLIHLPLIGFLVIVMKKPPLLSVIAVTTAYLLCTPRKWIGTFLAMPFHHSQEISYMVQIIITIPMAYFICRFFAPHIAALKNESKKIAKLFAIVPLVYYVMEYILTVYSELLYKDTGAVAGFLDSNMAILYFFFSIVYLHEISQRKEAEMDLKINLIKSEQAEKEIDQLKKNHEQAVIYRHDLLHHLNYLSSCLESGNTKEALAYMKEICTDLHNQKVETYCTNNSINLIMSAYIAKAKGSDIGVVVDFEISDDLTIPVTDLCTLLANGMDNAIHACEKIKDIKKRSIHIAARMQKNKLFIKIENPFEGTIEFDGTMPVAKEYGHGTGTRSIALIVKKHNGLFNFEAADNVFTMIVAV